MTATKKERGRLGPITLSRTRRTMPASECPSKDPSGRIAQLTLDRGSREQGLALPPGDGFEVPA
ncbi:hypothetical protein PtB15_5B193 [Puccinia triticina]|nr:hypothetical protein PtB15_5B193 [Puccinia triticina]